MESSIPSPTIRRSPLLLFSLVLTLILLPSSTFAQVPGKPLTYRNGPVLSGNLNLALIWYGRVGKVQKNAIRTFIKSLNNGAGASGVPQVANWWKIVESYQSAAKKGAGPSPKINVRVVRQVVDSGYSIGKVLIADYIKPLAAAATGGMPNTIAVIFAAKDVTVEGACTGKCSVHGAAENMLKVQQPYIIVGNPEVECPGVCGWPFHKADYGVSGPVLLPPSGDIGADSLVMNFASALADTVTNPYNTGFFNGLVTNKIEAGTNCPGMFGTGAYPGNTGKVYVNPSNGGAFNAQGWRGKRFLLPALWNPKTNSCWTTM